MVGAARLRRPPTDRYVNATAGRRSVCAWSLEVPRRFTCVAPPADSRVVTGSSFDRILQERLSASSETPGRPVRSAVPLLPDPGLRVLLHGWTAQVRRRVTPYEQPPVSGDGPGGRPRSPSAAAGPAPQGRPSAGAGSPSGSAGDGRSRPVRPLNDREARALATLRALGGDLDVGALDRDLRRVFRRLARRYHPDRHPGLDAPARAALAARFSTLVEAYRVLAARTTCAS